jgi:hypothetical protein
VHIAKKRRVTRMHGPFLNMRGLFEKQRTTHVRLDTFRTLAR